MAVKTEWDLSPLGTGEDDPKFLAERAATQARADAFVASWRDRTDWLEQPEILRQALDAYELFLRECGMGGGNEGYYFALRGVLDQSNTNLKARNKLVSDFSIRIANALEFFDLRLSKISATKQAEMLASPLLEPYKHFLERLFANARFLLSEAEEKIVTHMQETSYEKWVTMVSDFIAREEAEVLLPDGTRGKKNFSELLSLIESPEKNVRDDAAQALHAIFEKHIHAGEAELNAVLAYKKTIDELRGFTRPDESRHIGDDIETAAVDALRAAVTAHFDLPARFYTLKAQLLGLPKLAYHERNVPVGVLPKDYAFEDAIHQITETFTKLDPKFSEIFNHFVERGAVDAFPKKGKRSGAFCIHGLLGDPVYILLNFSGTFHDVQTFAHEVGHGINNELMREKQHALFFGAPTATAEVASTFFEDTVLQKYLESADEEVRLAILVADLNDAVSSIFRQIACYEFEFALHTAFRERGYLSATEIGGLFKKHMSAYMGPAVEQTPGCENWWVYWSHIRSFFYVYSYASGLLISKALVHFTRADTSFIEKVKTFLSAGLSDSPRNIFRACGIDIADPAFWESGLQEIENRLAEAEALAKRLGKI